MPLDFDRLAVFPLHRVVDGQCGCGDPGCPTAGKHPLVMYSELGVAEKWGGPEGDDYGFGIATGHRSGVFVVDVDVRDDRNGLAALVKMGEFPKTFTVRTPTGGYHFFFELPDFPVKTSGNQVALGVDIRGEGGFVVAPESPHKNGGIYKVVVDVPPAKAPAWLLELPCLRGSVRVGASESSLAPVPIAESHPEWARRVGLGVAKCLEAPAHDMGDGPGGSNKLFVLALYLVRSLELPIPTAHALIDQHYSPRCAPAWTDTEIAHKLENARDSSDRLPGIPPSGWDAMIEWATKPAAVQAAITASAARGGSAGGRRVHVVGHEYGFIPGEGAALSDMRKAPCIELSFILASHEEWTGSLQYDELRNRIWAVDPPVKLEAETNKGFSDKDVASIRMWFQSKGITASKEEILDAINAAADRQSFHPVKDYLESCRGSRKPGILDNAATCLFGTSDPLANTFFKRTLIAAVRRTLHPGCQVDTVLVLLGDQGKGKTSLVRLLFGEEFTRSQMPDLGTKDASQALQGKWAIELAELDRVLRAETSTVKEFLTRTADDYRPPYGRADLHFPRQCVFIGTTNDDTFLRDSSGNRRFWPIAVRHVDLEWLRANRDALWAEALALVEAGEPHWFTAEEEVSVEKARETFVANDPWHEQIEEYLKGRKRVKAGEVYENAIARGTTDLTKYSRAEMLRVVDTLRRLGCKPLKSEGQRLYLVPDALAALPKVDLAKKYASAMAN